MSGDPFDPDPEGVSVGEVRVTVMRAPAGFTAKYEWTGSADVLEPTGSFHKQGTTGRDCLDALEDLATSLATYFKILGIRYAEKLAAQPAPTPTSPAPKTPTTVPPAPPELRPYNVLFFGVGARADFGNAWGAVFGVTLEGGLRRQQWRWGGWSVMGAFRWAPQQPGIGPLSTDPAVDVSSSLVAGNLTGCVYRAWPVSLAGCVVGELGATQQSAATPAFPNLHQTALFAGGGVGARIEIPLSDRLYVQMGTDVVGVGKLAGGTYQWRNVTARSFGGAAGGLGAGLGVSF